MSKRDIGDIILYNISYLLSKNKNPKSKRNLLNKWFQDSIKSYLMEKIAAPLLIDGVEFTTTSEVRSKIDKSIPKDIPIYIGIIVRYYEYIIKFKQQDLFEDRLNEMIYHFRCEIDDNFILNYNAEKNIRQSFICFLLLKFFQEYQENRSQLKCYTSFFELWNACFPQIKQQKRRLSKYDMKKKSQESAKQENHSTLLNEIHQIDQSKDESDMERKNQSEQLIQLERINQMEVKTLKQTHNKNTISNNSQYLIEEVKNNEIEQQDDQNTESCQENQQIHILKQQISQQTYDQQQVPIQNENKFTKHSEKLICMFRQKINSDVKINSLTQKFKSKDFNNKLKKEDNTNHFQQTIQVSQYEEKLTKQQNSSLQNLYENKHKSIKQEQEISKKEQNNQFIQQEEQQQVNTNQNLKQELVNQQQNKLTVNKEQILEQKKTVKQEQEINIKDIFNQKQDSIFQNSQQQQENIQQNDLSTNQSDILQPNQSKSEQQLQQQNQIEQQQQHQFLIQSQFQQQYQQQFQQSYPQVFQQPFQQYPQTIQIQQQYSPNQINIQNPHFNHYQIDQSSNHPTFTFIQAANPYYHIPFNSFQPNCNGTTPINHQIQIINPNPHVQYINNQDTQINQNYIAFYPQGFQYNCLPNIQYGQQQITNSQK